MSNVELNKELQERQITYATVTLGELTREGDALVPAHKAHATLAEVQPTPAIHGRPLDSRGLAEG